jgi:hypothetical protein
LPQDDAQAFKWLSLAATHFAPALAEMRLAAEVARDRVAARMTAQQITAAQALVRAWQPR